MFAPSTRDLWPPSPTSKFASASDLLRPNGGSTLLRWVRGRVERPIQRAGSCSQGPESTLDERLESDQKGGLPQSCRLSVNRPHRVPGVLQGGDNMEDPSSSKHIAVVGGNDDPEPVRAGVRVDGGREHQYVCESAS